MSCWVVPAIAAELWGVPLTQVLERIRNGHVPSKTEYGFVLVDVAPHSPCITPGKTNELRPTTFVAAPRRPEPPRPEPARPEPARAAVAQLELQRSATDELAGGGDEGELDWRKARQAASLMRRRPRSMELTQTAA